MGFPVPMIGGNRVDPPTLGLIIGQNGVTEAFLRALNWDGSDWSVVGNPLSLGNGATGSSLAAFSGTRALRFDTTLAQLLEAYAWDGEDFSDIGGPSSLSVTGSNIFCSIAPLTFGVNDPATFAIGVDGSTTPNTQLASWDFSGGSLTHGGDNLVSAETGGQGGCALTATTIARAAGTTLRTYELSGGSWAQLGNSFSLGGSASQPKSATALTATRIAVYYGNGTNFGIQILDWDGSDWATVGNRLVFTPAQFGFVAAISATEIAVWLTSDNELRTYAFDGSDLNLVGNPLTTLSGTANNAGITSFAFNVLQ